MPLDLNDVALFVRVVERGGFAKVARDERVPTSTVSRAIARLEATLGTQLLVRTTRSVVPTAEGQRFHREVAPAVGTLVRAARGIDAADKRPRGRLRVTAPNDVGATFLGEVVAAFTARHPAVQIETVLTQRTVNLVEEGIDVALRAAQRLPDSTLVARKIGELEQDLYASVAYVEAHGLPTSLPALAQHRVVLFRREAGRATWTLTDGQRDVAVEVEGGIASDDHLLLRAAVLAGAGIGLLPRIVVRTDVAAGRLVRVLPEWAGHGASLYFVHPPMETVPSRITAFRDFVLAAFHEQR